MALRPRPQKPGAPRPAPVARPKGEPPIALIVVAVVLIGFGAVVVVMMNSAQKRAASTSCANNLSQLWKLQNVYMSQFGGKTKSLPEETGSAFWLKLSKTQPPLVDPATADVFICPVKGDGSKCDYLGPGSPASSLPQDAIVGADKPGNHRDGGNVVRKSGDVVEHADPDFRKLTAELRP